MAKKPLNGLPDEVSGPRAAAASRTGADGATKTVPPAVAENLEKQLTSQSAAASYVPTLPIFSSRSTDWLNYEFFQDIEAMRKDECIRLPLSMVLSVQAHAEWEIEASSGPVAEFIAQQLQWFWSNARGRIHEEGAIFGWCPGENTFDIHDGIMVQKEFDTFHPQDADPLVRDGKPCGIRVNNVEGGHKDLWAFRDDVPNKGFWFTHMARHGLRRGQSLMRPAWCPWRRLMGRDGGEEIIDLGVYRSGVGDTIVKHPNKMVKATDGNAPSFAVNGTWHTRDEARSIAEARKAGSALAIPSETDNKGNPLWAVEITKADTAVLALIDYVGYLEQLCSKAMGVPPELLQAAETGSGYSGRAIPLQAFLSSQQRPLDDMTRYWLEQTGLPLAKWNFGPDVWVRITPVPLVESYRKAAWDGPGGQQGGAPPGMGGQPAPPMPQEAPPVATLATDPWDWDKPVKLFVTRREMTVRSASPAPLTLSTGGDLETFADRLANMSVSELSKLAEPADELLGIDL